MYTTYSGLNSFSTSCSSLVSVEILILVFRSFPAEQITLPKSLDFEYTTRSLVLSSSPPISLYLAYSPGISLINLISGWLIPSPQPPKAVGWRNNSKVAPFFSKVIFLAKSIEFSE